MHTQHIHSDDPYTTHRDTIWGLCYRMTGSHADADDLTQDTFTQLLSHPPKDPTRPLRPWLITVAMNASRDALRRRKQRQSLYKGPWLPSPTHLPNTSTPPPNAETRYSNIESATLAFLVALEVLTPLQRAVLILRDVLGESTADCAGILQISQPNVKTSLHRARSHMRTYNANPVHPSPTLQTKTQATLGRFLQALISHDIQALRETLADDVTSTADANGAYISSVEIMYGSQAVTRLMYSIHTRRRSTLSHAIPTTLNGLPALLLSFNTTHHRDAPHSILACDVCPHQERITALYIINAPDKIAHIFPQKKENQNTLKTSLDRTFKSF